MCDSFGQETVPLDTPFIIIMHGEKWIIFTLSTIIDYLEVFDDLELFRRLHCWVESTFLIDDLNFRTFLSGRWHWLPARQDALWQKWKNIARMRNCPGIVGSSDLETLNQSFWDQIYFALSDNISSVKCHSEPLWSSDKYHQIWPFCQPYDYEGVKCEGIILHVGTCRNIKLEAR